MSQTFNDLSDLKSLLPESPEEQSENQEDQLGIPYGKPIVPYDMGDIVIEEWIIIRGSRHVQFQKTIGRLKEDKKDIGFIILLKIIV